MGYPNTSNFVKNTPLRVMFSTLFSVFGYPDETLSLMFDTLLQNHSEGLFTWREGVPANRATLGGLTSHTFL